MDVACLILLLWPQNETMIFWWVGEARHVSDTGDWWLYYISEGIQAFICFVPQINIWPQTCIYWFFQTHGPAEPTCVIEDSGTDGAVLKHCVCGPDVLKVTVFKQWVLKLHWLHLYTDKPMGMGWETHTHTRAHRRTHQQTKKTWRLTSIVAAQNQNGLNCGPRWQQFIIMLIHGKESILSILILQRS